MIDQTEKLKAIPRLPGVYIMKNAAGDVIYIGKAKILKNRVRSYFSGGDGRVQISYLVKQVAEIDTIVTTDERQALVLEADLINKYKPRYKIRLKDDKSYLVVRVDTEAEWPRLEVIREVKDDGARYFGPFAFGYEVKTMLELIKRTIPLRTCSDRVMHNRVRPCLEYQIKRCAGPCCLNVDRGQYREWLQEAMLILEGKNTEVQDRLNKDMEVASEELRFEDAAKYRDAIQILEKIAEDKPQYEVMPGSRDAIGYFREADKAEISVLAIRRGRIFEAKTFGFEDVIVDDKELLGSFVTQYYQDRALIPEEILLPFDLEDEQVRAEILSERHNETVKILFPKKGDKARLIELALDNARENFKGRFQSTGPDSLLESLRRSVNLDQLPRAIECVDISHFQGGETVASVVFFEDGKPDKTRYRCFHLSQEGRPDDFASMREVITRHLSRCAEENTLGDLMIIDGGEQQLAQGLSVRRELGIDRPQMVGLAKKRTIKSPYMQNRLYGSRIFNKPERVFVEGSAIPIILKPGSPELNLIERIRDEAHRFAITFHRKSRSKRIFKSALDGIPGVGPKRKLDLLREFGSIEAIKGVASEELATRGKLPVKLAERILTLLKR